MYFCNFFLLLRRFCMDMGNKNHKLVFWILIVFSYLDVILSFVFKLSC